MAVVTPPGITYSRKYHDSHAKGQAMSYGKAVRDELRVPTRELRHAIPQVYAGYKGLHDSALAAGALDARTKELIALAIAVSKECDGCIAAHAHAAVWHGATPQEAAEAIGVTFLMNGGPATVYGARAFAAFREFYDQRAAQDLEAHDQQPPARGITQPDGHQHVGLGTSPSGQVTVG
jgi:AhpD family alkylhydroperoxidase